MTYYMSWMSCLGLVVDLCFMLFHELSRPAWIEVRNWEVKTGGIVRTFALDGCAGRVVEPNLITSTVSGLTEQGPWPWIGYLLTKGSDRSSTFVIHRSNVYLGSSNRRLYDFHLQLYTWFPHGNAPSFVLDCHCVINTSFGHVDNKSEIWLLMVGARVFGNCESVVRLNDEGLGTRFVVIRQSKFPDVWEARRVCRGIASPPNERCVNETVRLWPISRYRVLHPQIP